MRPPRLLHALAIAGMLLGMLGFGRALAGQILPYLGSQEAFVSAERRDLELRNSLASPEVSSDVVARAGDQLGERAWARRGIVVPLGIAHLVLSLLLTVGALRAFAGSPWGLGAWRFACAVSIPYTIVSAVVSFVAARDGWDASAALATNLSLQLNVPVETLADWELLRDRVFILLGAALSTTYFGLAWFYLRRRAIRALYGEG